jgi:hypothetical protein
LNDKDRERLIEAWRVVLELDVCREVRIVAIGRMRELINERSPRQVAQMEIERGLRVS